MFKHDMKEKKNSKVRIEDLDAETIKSMLEFIYSRKFEAEEWDIEELLAAADKYAFDTLKQLCTEDLCKKLNIENVANFLILADKHSAESLKVKAMSFISKNLIDICQREALKNVSLTQPSLYYEAVTAAIKQLHL